MNQESTVIKKQQLLSGVVQIKHKDDCLKKINKLPKGFMMWGCISFREPAEMIINTFVYIEILDNFPIWSRENSIGGEKVIFQDDNASCHIAEDIKAFLQEKPKKP